MKRRSQAVALRGCTHSHSVVLITVSMCVIATGCSSAPARELGGEWQFSGNVAPDAKVASYMGDGHCDTESVEFLSVASPVAATVRRYVRDLDGAVSESVIGGAYIPDARLPPDAGPSGYSNNDLELWLAPSDSERYAYLVDTTASTAQAWPRVNDNLGCD